MEKIKPECCFSRALSFENQQNESEIHSALIAAGEPHGNETWECRLGSG